MNPLAVVTGGTKGIGRATAERFLAGGFDVVTCAREGEALRGFREAAQRRYIQSSLLIHQADLSVRAETDDFVDYVNSLQRRRTGK